MTSKEDALLDIVATMRREQLTLSEVENALAPEDKDKSVQSSSLLFKIFGYIGGILVFAGAVLLVSMQWEHLSPLGRIAITLGPGLVAFCSALALTYDERYEKASTAFFLVAALLEPTGILVALKEYIHGDNPAHGVLLMCGVMVLQQGCVFYARQRTVLAFTSIFFALSFCATAFDILHVANDHIGVAVGIVELLIAYGLSLSKHQSIAPIHYFFGSAFFLSGVYGILEKSSIELLYLGVCCFFIYISIIVRSRILLINGTLALLGYISYFTELHFAHNIGWPITLMLIGLMVIGLGVGAVKLNERFLKQSQK